MSAVHVIVQETNTPAAVFSGISMSPVDGFDLLYLLRQFSSQAPVFFLAHTDNPERRAVSKLKGAAGYLPLPLTPTLCQEVLRSYQSQGICSF